MSWIIVLNLGQSVFEKHMRNCQIPVVQRRTFTYHMEEITGNTFIYIKKWLVIRNWTEWMKGICHVWSRGRHFSPSMPGDRYLKLGSKSDHRAEISGNIVRYNALAPRPEVLRSFCSIYANICSGVVFFEQVQVSLNNFIRPLRKIENGYFAIFQSLLISRLFGLFGEQI